MRTPQYVSYHTDGYEALSERLRASLARFGLQHYVEHVKASASWDDCCRNRHAFINAMLDKHKPNPVVWIDCDCVVLQRPQLFQDLAEMNGSYDAALYNRPSGIIGGTIYADQGSRWFWDLCQKQTGLDADGQVNAAHKIARADKLTWRVWPLEPSYQYCPWLLGTTESPLPREKVVILHEMAATGRKYGKVR
jgi:hypothetical protein